MSNILIISGNLKNWNKNSGGVERTATLAEAFPNDKVTFLCFSWDDKSEDYNINNIRFIKPRIEERALRHYRAHTRQAAKNNFDIIYKLAKPHIKDFIDKAKELASDADVIILDHYSVAPLVEELYGIAPIIYNSHNAEITMAKQMYPKDVFAVEAVLDMERSAIEKSVAITYCSSKDLEELSKEYLIPTDRLYVPNGTEMQILTEPKDRHESKDIIFVGSGHPPNSVAIKRILEIASLNPEYDFLVCGRASEGFMSGRYPKNFKALGRVSDEMLDKLFKQSFAFINPMDSGSGTHLKMMKALSYGIPIITSPIGARGFSEAEIDSSMLIIDSNNDVKQVLKSLEDIKLYSSLSKNGHNISKQYDWETIKVSYADFIKNMISKFKTTEKKIVTKEKVLIYSIVRNIEDNFNNFYTQLKGVVSLCKEYDFYLSIYENDSKDNTKKLLTSADWSFFSGVSIISENIGTQFFGPVKDEERVVNLSNARNKALTAGGFLEKVDYVLVTEGDNTYLPVSVQKLLNFKNKEPNFDIVSAVSLRPNGKHYDWWATRTGPEFNKEKSELDPKYQRKPYGRYYSTSNGLCLYRAKPFQDGARYGWINKVTQEADCEMVVVCQEFRDMGNENIFILYDAFSNH